jgi:isopenicillin-N epimerase
MRDLFLLDPDVIFLNHGSFGACPKPVFDEYQRRQRDLERQPVEFLGRRLDGLLAESRARLAAYLGTQPDNLVYVQNATAGVNTVARSLIGAHRLQPGDQILTTDHEYGACDNTWRFIAELSGLDYVRQHIPLPYTDADAMVEALWQGVTSRTRVIYLSHITSCTGVIFPIEAICRRAREAGIITVIDGAHAPGQIPLDLDVLGADYYTGNLHKWLCAPKGAAFLYVRPEHQAEIAPLVISWGYSDLAQTYTKAQGFIQRHQWQGTHDPAAWLTVPAAIDFQQAYDWDGVRAACHALAVETQARLAELTGLLPVVAPEVYAQMVIAALPDNLKIDPFELKRRLYDECRVEIPVTAWFPAAEGGAARFFVRASFQGYNTRADADALLDGLSRLLPALY